MISRRQVIQLASSATLVGALPAIASKNDTTGSTVGALIQRPIPSSGELVPVVGMGTSRTFDTDADPQSLKNLAEVMNTFIAGRGTIIDSSPMYGRAESRVGDVLKATNPRPDVFAATKVWIEGREAGIAQMEESAKRMNVERFDLIAVHNLKDWKTHLATLKKWKEQGKVRYIGITTSHGRNHDEFVKVMESEPLDFVQFSYNMEDRVAEQRIFPIAQEKGIATMINRPFQRGKLFKRVQDLDIPEFAQELGCNTWAQFFLKYIIGNPAVTCVIPATAKVHHMQDNMQANFGEIPNVNQRVKMLRAVLSGF